MSKRVERDEELTERQEEVWQLHCQFLSNRAIAARLGINSTQVHRAIEQVRTKLRRRRSEEFFLDLADRLTAAAQRDLADSWDTSEKATDFEVWNKAGEDKLIVSDFKALAAERSTRTRLLESIARFNGLDPLKQQDLALKQRLVEAQVAEKNQEARVTELERKQTRLEARLARAAAGDTGEFDQYFEAEEETEDE